MPGPLPDPNRRRRNAPTIPTTELPAGGRKGRKPKPPARLDLGDAALEWWRWAWSTPQAAAWDGGGFEEFLARRAALEDDLAALDTVAERIDSDDDYLLELVRRLGALAGGRLALLREMRELDDRLGLTPKGMAALRWRVVEVTEETSAAPDEVTKRRRERHARALEAAAGE